MVDVTFDYFGFLDKPPMTLLNPNRDELYSLGNMYNTKISLKYNALSEFNFELLQQIQDANSNYVVDPAYALLKAKRLITIRDFGIYQIIDVEEDRDGKFPIKKVKCTSWESELITKQVSAVSGSFKFYDLVSPTGTFLDYMLSGTGWSVGQIDSDLLNLYRDFDTSSTNVYNVLMTSAEIAFNCIFTFSVEEKEVNAFAVNNATYDTSIYLSFENLLKQTTFKEISEEIVTAMEVFGGDGLDIRAVNPLGTDTIYNFGYYQQRNFNGKLLWMSEGLNTAISNWVTKINLYQPLYGGYLTSLKNYNITLGEQQAQLSIYNDELAALIQVKKVQIEGGLDLSVINAQIQAKRNQKQAETNLINTTNLQIAAITTQIVSINNDLSLMNVVNFTVDQQDELRPLIFQNSYQNSNIIQTEIMTPAEVQDQSQQLYDQAQDVLSRTSQPRYEFTVDAANFVALKEYEVFTQQLGLGSNVTIETEEGVHVTTTVLEINMSFDKLDDFSLVFSNRLRLDNGNYISSDLLNNINQTTSSVISDKGQWGLFPIVRPTLLDINSILNTANNQIINSSLQEIEISPAGIIGKRANADGTFSNEQIWITSNLIVFTDDAFATAKTALGKLTLANGGTKFGLAAEVVFGKLVAGNSLLISNLRNDGQVSNFTLDGSGCVLTNSTFLINSSSARNSLELSAANGFVLKNKVGQVIISTDGSGNLSIVGAITANSGTFKGRIEAASGLIGALTIDSQGLSDSFGNYIRSNSFKLGPLTVSGSTGTFDGNFSASRLTGQIVNSQISNNTITAGKIHDLNADSLVAGTIQGISIYGSNISYGGTLGSPLVSMFGIGDTGTFRATSAIQLYVEANDGNHTVDSAIFISDQNIALYLPKNNFSSSNTITIGLGFNTTLFAGTINVANISTLVLENPLGIPANYKTGLSGTFPINTPSGVRNIYLRNGWVYKIDV